MALRMRWEDVDYDTGRVLSRAADLKRRTDTRPEIRAALPYLEKIAGADTAPGTLHPGA